MASGFHAPYMLRQGRMRLLGPLRAPSPARPRSRRPCSPLLRQLSSLRINSWGGSDEQAEGHSAGGHCPLLQASPPALRSP